MLVAAPTGAGKTIVGEFAVHLALATGRKAFYTTPIKALSNQKYHDLVRVHGADKVGLLTGDSSVNGEAPVVVMTTEVLRNMMYAGSRTLDGLGLRRHGRGALPGRPVPRGGVGGGHHPPARARAGRVAVGHGEQRRGVRRLARRGARQPRGRRLRAPAGAAVPARARRHDDVRPVRRQPGQPRPAGRHPHLRAARALGRRAAARRLRARRAPARRPTAAAPSAGGGRGPGGGAGGRGLRPRWTPRRGRDPGRGHRRARPRRAAARHHLHLQPGRLRGRRRPAARRRHPPHPRARGAAHPAPRRGAGRLAGRRGPVGARLLRLRRGALARVRRPPRRACCRCSARSSRSCSPRPASGPCSPPRHWRSASTCRPAPWCSRSSSSSTARRTSTSRPPSTPSSPAGPGRRGIDVEGHAVVQWARGVDPLAVGGLASTRTYPLRSSFRPTYNMAVNLVAQVGREVAREILETSFAQFQADRAVVGIATAVRRNEEGMEGYAEAMHCHLGDFREYAALRRALADAEKEGVKARSASRRAEAAVSPRGAAHRRRHPHPGRPARRVGGRRAAGARRQGHPDRAGRRHRGQAVPPAHPGRRARAGRVRHARQGAAELQPQVAEVAPRPGDLAAHRRAARLRGLAAPPGPARSPRGSPSGSRELRRELKAHPCHQCPDREDARPVGRAVVAAQARDGRPAAQGRGPHQHGGAHLRPDLRRPRGPGLPRRRRHRRHRARASGCAGSTPRRTCSPPSACATTCGSGSTPRGWPPPCRPWCTSRGTRRPRSRRGCRTTTSPRR